MKARKVGLSPRNVLEALTGIYLLSMCSLYMLYPGTLGYSGITNEKWKLYLALTAGYLILAGAAFLELTLVTGQRLPSPVACWRGLLPEEKLIALYWLLSLVSTLLSSHRSVAFWGGARRDGFVTLTLYCLSALLISRYPRVGKWLFTAFSVSLCLNGALVMAQLRGWNPLGLYPSGMTYFDKNVLYSGEFLGTFGNVDILAAFLCIAIPILWASLLRLKAPGRALLLLPLAACLYMLIRAHVSAGFLGVAGCLLLSAPVHFPSPKARRVAWYIVAGVCLAGLGSLFLFGDRLGGFFYEAHQLLHGNWDDSFGSGRLFIWRETLPLVGEHPLFGGGLDTLGLRLSSGFQRYDPNLGILIRSGIDVAHNEYLNILVNQGALALAAYLLLLGRLAVRFVKQAPLSKEIAICGSAILAYSIQAFFGISSPVSTPYLWICVGLFLSCAHKPAPKS